MIDEAVIPFPTEEPELETPENTMVVRQGIMDRINDSMRLERDWRTVGRTIQAIYKGKAGANGKYTKWRARYNILNANVGVLLPSLFAKTPTADIRTRAKKPSMGEMQVAEVLEQTCNTLLDDTASYENMKRSVKELLLPGRGNCRVRWEPIIETKDTVGQDGQPSQVHEKLLDTLRIEHVYWEDYTHEAVSDWSQCGWVAYRHLFTRKSFEANFGSAIAYQKLVREGKSEDVYQWTDQTAYSHKSSSGRGTQNGSGHTRDELQDVIMKAMVWEFWDKSTREVIWICEAMGDTVLRIDPDTLQLANFFPSPNPLLAVTTTDTLLPMPEYMIYQDLAIEIDDTSDRIAQIVNRIKVRGAYNAAVDNLSEILSAKDGKMLPLNEIDFADGIDKHIWLQNNADNIAALQALYQAREQSKQAMYEVTGISDIVRGQSKASETLGAQKMKTAFATLRISDRKDAVENWCRDLIRIMAEVMALHWDPESFYYVTGIQLQPEALQIMRNDLVRMSRIDVETDSTIAEDQAAAVEEMGQMMQSLAMAMQQIMPMVQGGFMPPNIAMGVLKMLVKPFKNSRDVILLLEQYEMMLSGMAPGAQPGAPGTPGNEQPQTQQGGPTQ